MGKFYNKRGKIERTTEEIEFERNKEECTFTPNCKRLPSFRFEEAPPQILKDKTVQKDIERLKKAREEKERIKKIKERGIYLKEGEEKQ